MMRCRSIHKQRLAQRRPTGAFTLVELLVVISIIALLAGVVLAALSGVQETARVDRTKAQIARINSLLMEKWEEYKTRRVEPFPWQSLSNEQKQWLGLNNDGTELPDPRMRSHQRLAFLRLLALREMMRLDLPERYTDIGVSLEDFPRATASSPLSGGTALWRAYREKVNRNARDREIDIAEMREKNQQAECLYMILFFMRDGDAPALSFFRETEIQDTDDDGMLEIVDAWGTPIRWLRWAPGHRSSLQLGPAEGIPDQFDPTLSDYRYDMSAAQLESNATIRPFEMYPLVFSAGPDKVFDLKLELNDGNYGVRYSQTDRAFPNDPYYLWQGKGDPSPWLLGEPNPEEGDPSRNESVDNLDNHSLVTR